jgi:uncharacterized protein (TIGR03435 family)
VVSTNCRARRLIAIATFSVSGLFAQDLTGTWQGVVKNPDSKQDLRTVIKIESSDTNPIRGNFWSIDQTYLVFPSTLTIQGSVIKMSIPGIGASWQGKLSADGETLSGTLKGFSIPVEWTMKRITPDQAWAIPKPPVPVRPMPADADPAFDVVTVKPSKPDATGQSIRVQGATVSLSNITLMDLATYAFGVHKQQIIGAPAWSTSQHYDISGKATPEGEPNADQVKVMLRKLLADRFQLAFHKEQKELSVYTLSVAKGGAKISKNTKKNETTGIIFRGPGSVLLNDVSMDDFSRMLQNSAVDRPVVNQTALSGTYDFSLVWTPDNGPAVPNPNALAPLDKADGPPDVFGATQQQLGLKLDATRLQIEVLVIDKVEKPSDN